MVENRNASKKIDIFFRTALKYYGKEIGLTSNQIFSIDQICDSDIEQEGEFNMVFLSLGVLV